MTNKTLKIIAGFLLVMSLATPSVAAVSTVTLTAAELAAPSFIKSGVSYLLPASAKANVPSVGTATATGFSRTMLARVGPTAAIITAGTIGYAAFRTHVETHPNDYPTMYPLMFPGLSYPSTIDNITTANKYIDLT